jgi:dimethylargininase
MIGHRDTAALVHAPSPLLNDGQRTHRAREAIDFERAQAQHGAYCLALRESALAVRLLDVNRDEPDGVFIEDTAIVLDEVAILCSMGTETRRREPAAIESILAEFRDVRRIELPAQIEGGDVLRIGRELLVGFSCRTNAAGIEALAGIAGPLGYKVSAVPVGGCLHLKTACTALPDGRMLVNSGWIDTAALRDRELVEVTSDEPWAANVLPIGNRVILPSAHLRMTEQIERLGFEPLTVDISEFAKAEGGVTCLSLIF